MAKVPDSYLGSCGLLSSHGEGEGKGRSRSKDTSDKNTAETEPFPRFDKTDYMATVVEQAAAKIVMKVPQVIPGDYNVSVQEGDRIFIMPVRFKVQQ